jgi:hypothetical protein
MSNSIAIEAIQTLSFSVEVINDNNAAVIEIDKPTIATEVEIIHPGPQGPAAPAFNRRHSWEPPYDYLGIALLGSSENNAVWSITRLTISSAGMVTAKQKAVNHSWSNRATATYS